MSGTAYLHVRVELSATGRAVRHEPSYPWAELSGNRGEYLHFRLLYLKVGIKTKNMFGQISISFHDIICMQYAVLLVCQRINACGSLFPDETTPDDVDKSTYLIVLSYRYDA